METRTVTVIVGNQNIEESPAQLKEVKASAAGNGGEGFALLPEGQDVSVASAVEGDELPPPPRLPPSPKIAPSRHSSFSVASGQTTTLLNDAATETKSSVADLHEDYQEQKTKLSKENSQKDLDSAEPGATPPATMIYVAPPSFSRRKKGLLTVGLALFLVGLILAPFTFGTSSIVCTAISTTMMVLGGGLSLGLGIKHAFDDLKYTQSLSAHHAMEEDDVPTDSPYPKAFPISTQSSTATMLKSRPNRRTAKPVELSDVASSVSTPQENDFQKTQRLTRLYHRPSPRRGAAAAASSVTITAVSSPQMQSSLKFKGI